MGIYTKVLLLIYFSFICFSEGKVSYKGYKVVRIVPQTHLQLKITRSIIDSFQGIDVWRPPSQIKLATDVNLSPLQYSPVVRLLTAANVSHHVMIEDVQDLMDEQIKLNGVKSAAGQEFDYGKYHTLDEINDWLKNKSIVFKNFTSMFTVATSYEGRPMMGIKISTPSDVKRSAFFIEGGIHAREWISPATVIYMTGKLLDLYKLNEVTTKVVDMFEWYILPVTNPDGYNYTWTTNRNWRKTRSRHGVCVGVDPNRNWDFHWCENGASKNPCADDYCGPHAFSEPEVKGVADFIASEVKNAKAFIDFHSYSQLWMDPWGWTKALPSDFAAEDKGAFVAVEALEAVFGTKYKHGSIANIIYVASGSSADWTYGVQKIKYSYGVELRDTGKYGFLLPPQQIVPSGEETLQGVMALAEYVYNN